MDLFLVNISDSKFQFNHFDALNTETNMDVP